MPRIAERRPCDWRMSGSSPDYLHNHQSGWQGKLMLEQACKPSGIVQGVNASQVSIFLTLRRKLSVAANGPRLHRGNHRGFESHTSYHIHFGAHSSDGQSGGLIIPWSQVQVLLSPPILMNLKLAGVAQWKERLRPKEKVAGSTPVSRTKESLSSCSSSGQSGCLLSSR